MRDILSNLLAFQELNGNLFLNEVVFLKTHRQFTPDHDDKFGHEVPSLATVVWIALPKLTPVANAGLPFDSTPIGSPLLINKYYLR